MSNLFSKSAVFSSILAATATASMAYADQPKAGFTVTPNIGYSNSDSNRDIKDNETYGIGLGYQFDNPWAIEFNYLNADSELHNGQDVDADQYRLDGLYHFANNTDFTPYVAAGLGTTQYSSNVDGDGNTQFNAGGGVKYALKDNLAVRADYRVLEDLNSDHTDQVASLGLQMTFGGTNDAAQQTVANQTTAPTPVTNQEDEWTPGIAATSEPDPIETKIKSEPVEVEPTKTILPYNVQFAFDSDKVTQANYEQLQEIADHLKANPDQVAQVQGYADDTGSPDYNLELSEDRAQSVAQRLVADFNIEPDRIETVGFGEKNPLVANTTEENRQLNRRVTTVVFGTRDDLEMATTSR